MLGSLCRIIATFFGTGYLPLMPGTFGSLAGFLIFILVKPQPSVQIIFLAVFLFLGFYCSGKAEKQSGSKDPKFIVIDEVAGIFLTLLFLPFDLKLLAAGFLLFRALDTIKPYPADRLQKLNGSAGIMLDDIIAALYANIILQFVSRILLKIPS